MKTPTRTASIRLSLVTFAGLATAAVVGAPDASAQESAGETIYACAQPGSGILYVVEEAGDCKSHRHTPLEWSVGGGTDDGGDEAPGSPAPVTESLTLLNGWQPYGDAYRAPSATRHGDVVVVEGLIRAGSLGLATRLPTGWAPDKRLVFNPKSNVDRTRVDVMEDGTIHILQGSSAWTSLSGIVFTVAEAETDGSS